VELLRRHLLDSAGFGGDVSSDFSARERHVTALEATLRCLETGRDALALHQAGELIAEDLRVAQDRLGSITGRYTSDDLLGEIFGSFCIGK
jgi:tRNA modification GTPase